MVHAYSSGALAVNTTVCMANYNGECSVMKTSDCEGNNRFFLEKYNKIERNKALKFYLNRRFSSDSIK